MDEEMGYIVLDPGEGFSVTTAEPLVGLIGDAPVPRYPKARVDIAEFMVVDGMFHMMMQTCGELRRAGASEQEVMTYRERAINGNPWIETARWVTVGRKR